MEFRAGYTRMASRSTVKDGESPSAEDSAEPAHDVFTRAVVAAFVLTSMPQGYAVGISTLKLAFR